MNWSFSAISSSNKLDSVKNNFCACKHRFNISFSSNLIFVSRSNSDPANNNLIILSGDRHRGGIYKEKTNGGNQLFELTSSSLNLPAGKLFKAKEELGPNRIGPTFLDENYGVIEINENKKITLSIKGLDQKTHNKININLS